MKQTRVTSLFILISIIFLILVVRLASLQLISHQRYRQLAKDNYVKPITVPAPRGIIYDRKGIIVADNIPTYTLSIDSNKVTQEEEIQIASLLETSSLSLQLEATYHSSTIKNVPFELICQLEERRENFPHISVITEPLRRYPFGELFSHLIGYVSEISKKELESYPYYRLSAFIGKLGIEKEYETFIRGKNGTQHIEVDAMGHELGELSYSPPEPGNSVWLTIDTGLQALTDSLLPTPGACVAMEPQTGEILIWVSKPGFDPNLFSAGISQKLWDELSTDSFTPLWDRVKSACYPPASIFKLITCIAGLRNGLCNPNTHQPIPCKGSIKIGRREYKCWEKHGSLNLVEAIIQSCDVYFYQLGMKLGVDLICREATRLGFGKKVGIDLPGESNGFMPSNRWYDNKYGKGRWSRGIAANLAIGQGEVLTTPLQILYFVSGISTYGILYTPRLVKKIVNQAGEIIFSSSPKRHTLPLEPNIIGILRQGMLGVVEEDDGTGRLARVPGIKVAGKTGTAQNPKGEDHAWFVAFAPYEKPQICIVVFVENGGMGGSVAAPIAGKIIQTYLNSQVKLP